MLSKLYQSDESTHDHTQSLTYEQIKNQCAHKIYITHVFKVITQ